MIIVRKHIQERERRQLRFLPKCEYLFYITNDWTNTPAEITGEQPVQPRELTAQLGSGVRALRAPVDNLMSNWAYMVMTSLAWNLKAWLALWTPPPPGRWHAKHVAEQEEILRMEFRTFVSYFIRVPCQIIDTGRKIVYRLLGWNVVKRLLSPGRPIGRRLRCR